MSEKFKTLVVGCGNMGRSHALAYQQLDAFEVVGVVGRGPGRSTQLATELGGVPTFFNFEKALKETSPQVVCISTYPDTHADFAIASMKAGAHVFLEKPLALTVAEAESVVQTAQKTGKKLIVGYILRVHPVWNAFIDKAKTLGKPLVMRMNLNQQSFGNTWATHRNLMQAMSPIVDCGVHYVDVMCRMTDARPISVSAIGARLSEEIGQSMYNYGQLQVRFADGSVGWYEAGWGPMVSETAFFVKDVIGPKGCVSIVNKSAGSSENIDGHTQANILRVHHAQLTAKGEFARADEWLEQAEEPDHYALCRMEQTWLHRAITQDLDLSQHQQEAIDSLRIVLAADESFRTGKTVELN